jgi:hypothetical protein
MGQLQVFNQASTLNGLQQQTNSFWGGMFETVLAGT